MAATILERIVETKRAELDVRKRECPPPDMALTARDAAPVRPFLAALSGPDTVALIAEIKKASPTLGLIRADFDAVAIAKGYDAGGAAALSVLTDETYFGGSLQILQDVRAAVSLPVLRKDFVIDPYQVYEARAAGADAVLLIVAILDEAQVGELLGLARSLGVDTLVEVHTAEEMALANRVGADLIGINNRDLKTFQTRRETTAELAAIAAPAALLAALSGISTRQHVEEMAAAGAHAVLVGEALMRQDDVAAAARALTGVPNR